MSCLVGRRLGVPTNGFFLPAELHRRRYAADTELTCSFSMSASACSCFMFIHVLLAPCCSPPAPLASFNQINMNSFASFVSALFLLLAVSSCSAFAPYSSFTGGQANAVVRSTRQSSSSNLSMIFGPKDDGSPGDYVCLGAYIVLH